MILAGRNLLIPVTLLAMAAHAPAQVVRVSVSSSGVQGNALSIHPDISADGRFVAFESVATNLVAGDTNAVSDVFVHDRQSSTTERVSVSSAGGQANGPSSQCAISDDGRFVTYESSATNLVTGDTNGQVDVFVHDRLTGITERVSLGTGGSQGSGASRVPAISADGRRVAFLSTSSSFVPGDTNGRSDIFVRDRQANTTIRVSVSSTGVQGNGDCGSCAISADGNHVAFETLATNLVTGDTNGIDDVYARNLLTGTTVRCSVPLGASMFPEPASGQPAISADGRFVAFSSRESNLVPGDSNTEDDIFVRDVLAESTTRVNISTSGQQTGPEPCQRPSVSGDGRYVTFHGGPSNLTPCPDGNGVPDVFLHDRWSGTTERVSETNAGTAANSTSAYAEISADGRFIAFASSASNLVSGDTNGDFDVFVRERGVPGAPFCPGDGSGSACPCNNSSPAGFAGCSNSSGFAGSLEASGTPSICDDTCTLEVVGLPDGVSSLFFQGTSPVNGGAGASFGDGLVCVGGARVRLGTKTAWGGAAMYPMEGDAPLSLRGAVPTGTPIVYQVWYRDQAAFCTTSTFNLTNGYQVTWRP